MLVKVNAKVGTEAAQYTAACHGSFTTQPETLNANICGSCG